MKFYMKPYSVFFYSEMVLTSWISLVIVVTYCKSSISNACGLQYSVQLGLKVCIFQCCKTKEEIFCSRHSSGILYSITVCLVPEVLRSLHSVDILVSKHPGMECDIPEEQKPQFTTLKAWKLTLRSSLELWRYIKSAAIKIKPGFCRDKRLFYPEYVDLLWDPYSVLFSGHKELSLRW